MAYKIQWRIGCSGFHYREWKHIFYPPETPQRKWFDYYCTRFNTLELNYTFYRFPQVALLENWHQESPEKFNFSIKAPRLITHFKQFKDVRPLLDDFYNVAKEGLKEKLGPILFQFHPKTVYSPELLEEILDQLDTSLTNVLEFRDVSWWRPDVYQSLSSRNVSFCGVSHPKLPDEPVMNTPLVYYRFHGVPILYKSEYPTEFLDTISDTIGSNEEVRDVYLYFNNTTKGHAIQNALYLQNKLHG
ncbi:DUF72 domain-containing protein [Pseudoflavitalea sp. G-6-1-2]|uniref:DUF72 domain-containing protein n=1 Tax=Pseudoflavitalea sp. G-6-1-2 TaxID=2728841 RepID=UPI00146A214B|nr:DUF72 domain-containing protein [Pseudoflavitalea sp. G-6-1-2]NML21086.1 DUF72 domain-containing protein [Pseudoflavitalea sp. G-6-1-2]